MSIRVIEVAGTSQGAWTQWAGQILVRVEQIEVHADLSSWHDLDAVLRRRIDSNVLVLAEHPAIGLAHALARGVDIDPEAWLDDWQQSARVLLAHAQRSPDTTLLANAAEVQRRPQRLAQLLRSRWEIQVQAPSRFAHSTPQDSLAEALAWGFVERDPALQEVALELLASCVVMPGARIAGAHFGAEEIVDGAEAGRRLAELLQTERDLAQVKLDRETETRDRNVLTQQLAETIKHQATTARELELTRNYAAALDRQLGEGRAALMEAERLRIQAEHELAAATRQRDALGWELSTANEAARSAGEEGKLLLQQLHEVQEALERMHVARRDAEKALLAVPAAPSAKALEKELRAAREECELLTLQTHQVQEELQRVHSEKIRLAHEAESRISLPGLADITIGEVSLVGVRDTPPHREVSFIVRQVQAGERRVAEASVRLVEHWGRPGLAIFADDGAVPLFKAWQESDREDGRPFMLLVHGEESAQRVFDAMGTIDWHLMQALALRLGQVLQDQAADQSPTWQSLAQRLLTSLYEQPAKLRYDSVVAVPAGQMTGEAHPYRLTLERVNYHGRSWPRLPITWQPSGPSASLDLELDGSSGPPLLAWPADANGIPEPRLRLPLSGNPDAPETRAIWDSLSGSDRRLVADLLSLMPILAVHVQAAAASTSSDKAPPGLQALAMETLAFGRAALQPARPPGPQVERRRSLLQRMARQMGVTAKSDLASTPTAEPTLDR